MESMRESTGLLEVRVASMVMERDAAVKDKEDAVRERDAAVKEKEGLVKVDEELKVFESPTFTSHALSPDSLI